MGQIEEEEEKGGSDRDGRKKDGMEIGGRRETERLDKKRTGQIENGEEKDETDRDGRRE